MPLRLHLILRVYLRVLGGFAVLSLPIRMATTNPPAYIDPTMGVVLIGYRGSGKTTIGRLLADRLGKSFIDCDALIVKKAARSIREIFLTGGEEEFRKIEMTVIAENAVKDCVIAVGGGAIIRKENQLALQNAGHHMVYLRCDAHELLRRIQGDPGTSDNRPSLTSLGGGIEEIQAVLEQREPIYKAT